MKLPWSTVPIFCADETELDNLLYWLSCQRLAYMNKYNWRVTAIIADRIAGEKGIQGYYVDVPWEFVKPRVNELEPQQAMNAVLRAGFMLS